MRAAVTLASIVALLPVAQAGIIPATKQNPNDDLTIQIMRIPDDIEQMITLWSNREGLPPPYRDP
jgi:hypothetical protein